MQVFELLSFLCLEPDIKMLLGPQTRCRGAAQDPFGLRSQPKAGCDTTPATCPLPDRRHLTVVALLAAAGSSCAMLWGLLDFCFCWE